MCDVVSITSLALVVAGTAATAYGAYQTDKATGEATTAELDRQKLLRDKADRAHALTIEGSSGKAVSKDAEAQAASRAAAYEAAAKQTRGYAPPGIERVGTDTSNRVVNDPVAAAYEQEANKAGNFVQQQGAAKASMQGLGDAFLNQAILTQNQGYEISKLANFMQGSANVLPYELNAAGHAGDSSETLGTILSTTGSILGAAGASGAIGGSAKAGTAAGRATASPTLAAAKVNYPSATGFIKTWRGYYPASAAGKIT